MKKIVIGLGLEERIAQCGFCGEMAKNCIKGAIPFKAWVKKVDYAKWVIDDWEFAFWGGKKVVGDMHLKEVVVGEDHKILDWPNICEDCVKQLYDQLSKAKKE